MIGTTGKDAASTEIKSDNGKSNFTDQEKKDEKMKKGASKPDSQEIPGDNVSNTSDVKNSDGKSYFTLKTDEEKKQLRQERKRKKKEAGKSGKKSKIDADGS